ncbi:hypothetical protein DFH28DRAFT_911558 [Melampsora americana]|nr:hypothetical protein DFH28DRAFT_911558 [Melampsora americana]
MTQDTKPRIEKTLPESCNLESTEPRPLTRFEICELLMLHTNNFLKWETTKTSKDSQLFKHTRIEAKEIHRTLIKSMGHEILMKETHDWNPLEWDWITFEKKKRSLVKGSEKKLLKAL